MKQFTPFKQGLFGGLAAIGVILLIFAAGVVVAQEGYDPEKDIDHNGQIDVIDIQEVAESWHNGGSPRGALHVFAGSVSVNGGGPAGYSRAGMHAACRADDPASHFCNIQEIENAWKTTGVDFVATGQVWIDNAVLGTNDPGYTGDIAAVSDWYGGSAIGDYPYNCQAWTNSNNAARGYILNTAALSFASDACDDTHPIACCK